MDSLEYAKQWLLFAETDLGSAQYLYNMYPIPIEIICFHCQQSAEKALKGFLVLSTITPPKTHDLDELYRLCEKINSNFNVILNSCLDLNLYSVQTRYPMELTITQTDLTEALENAKRILDFVRPLFPIKK